ncbi:MULTISPECIES: Rieske (2Fe-2S) protein [Nonomuraea]|jgi:nitrite reductase/ring-hydroxylating ferredoxin subunit|uniref:Cytochrome bc1 complex Rieske iron-sulfur subunit n=2 Tax=Nonomuraea TaxID=83681 RepID=A0ABW1C6J7_9ACTN|nr:MULTISPECIES: Rieske (2Fe-2S) protein [Nonomuraea]MDA0640317.1 Rieske (2Fe-2S) protein [Nonomuraea ferruginea]
MGEDLKSRRAVIAGVGAGGLTLALAACGGSDTTAATQEPAAPASSSAPSQAAPAQGGGLTTTSEIPVGGGKIFADQKVVVVQPAQGQFKAYGISCTHQGCPVDKVENGAIVCPCHGSKFKIEDGSVSDGPATKPLPEHQLTVEGDQISLA